jgi:hypothetical protein
LWLLSINFGLKVQKLESRDLGKKNNFSSSKVREIFWGQPSLLEKGPQDSFSGFKAACA